MRRGHLALAIDRLQQGVAKPPPKKMGKTASTSSRFAINKNLVSGDTRIASAQNSPSSPFAPFMKTQSWQTRLANTRSASS